MLRGMSFDECSSPITYHVRLQRLPANKCSYIKTNASYNTNQVAILLSVASSPYTFTVGERRRCIYA